MALDVLFFSDKQVRQKLFRRVEGSTRPLLVTATRHAKTLPPIAERAPFRVLEQRFGRWVDLVVVADEGTPEGMWRDPVGDLADQLFPEDRERAYQAATGYVLLVPGEAAVVVRKQGDVDADIDELHRALAEAGLPVPAPPARRPRAPRAGARGERGRASAPAGGERPRAATSTAASTPEPLGADPWQVLGVPRGCTAAEAKRAFRALVAQYHPDKVAHLAPEFQALAERRTRELLDAWAQLERALADEG